MSLPPLSDTGIERRIMEGMGVKLHKPVHAMFRKKFRDRDRRKEYIRRTVSGPSTVRLSKLQGEDADQVCLVVVADFQGRLVTAFPTTRWKLA